MAPIPNWHCVECHRAGEVAPMVFTSYQAVRPWAKAIKEKVVTATMPPWLADPTKGSAMGRADVLYKVPAASE